MSGQRPAAGDFGDCSGHYAIVAARFNAKVVDRLVSGAQDCLREHGIAQDDITVVRVPGAFELPQAVKRLVLREGYDAIIALGAVIRGATPHFEYVSLACAEGLSRVALESDCPVVFGVLTTDDTQQALARAGGKLGNKGYDAALAALEMVSLYRSLRET